MRILSHEIRMLLEEPKLKLCTIEECIRQLSTARRRQKVRMSSPTYKITDNMSDNYWKTSGMHTMNPVEISK